MIKFNNVTYYYEQQTFHFDFTLAKGRIVAVLGGSGAGKSTLLNLAAGFIEPSSGTIELSGKTVNTTPPHLRPLSILFQEQNLFSHLSVLDNIGLGLDVRLRLTALHKARIVAIAGKLSIDTLLERFPDELSGGQKQRVALARCFVQDKPLLLLDEPFSALDPMLRSEMVAIVKNLAEINHTTIVMVTHHIGDALAIADDYIFIEDGQVMSMDKIAMLNENNSNLAIQKYLQVS
ncbi:thiamine ABC transporter ATP-binding protein [Psychromonas sp. MME2]|uniref:thiamine ABC transporter ATP-binding protein n=1 Tax=unclassified Psychromonas TaxID=2614957 RepID=UPI00339C045C